MTETAIFFLVFFFHLLLDWRPVRVEQASAAFSSVALQGKKSTSPLDRTSCRDATQSPKWSLEKGNGGEGASLSGECFFFIPPPSVELDEAYPPAITAPTVNRTKAFFLRKVWMSSLEISSTFLLAFMVRMWMPSLKRCILPQSSTNLQSVMLRSRFGMI